MLTFSIDSQGNYVITEEIHSFFNTKTTVVRYRPDLKRKQVNDEPWCDTNQADVDWFNTHYRSKFHDANLPPDH